MLRVYSFKPRRHIPFDLDVIALSPFTAQLSKYARGWSSEDALAVDRNSRPCTCPEEIDDTIAEAGAAAGVGR